MARLRTASHFRNRLGLQLLVAAIVLGQGVLTAQQSGVSGGGVEPPETDGPAPAPDTTAVVYVWGHERLAWNQHASSPLELAQYVFTALVDWQYSQLLDGVACSSVPTEDGYECSSRLPQMAAGAHSIQLSTSTGADQPWSLLSSPLHLHLVAAGATDPTGTGPQRLIVDGVSLEAIHVDQALPANAVALAPLPDGGLLLGHEDGRVLMIKQGRSSEAIRLGNMVRSGSVELLSLAVDPDFSSTRAVFAAYASDDGLTVARMHESNGSLVNHAVIRTGLGRARAAAIAIGPDRKLYLAIGADPDGAAQRGDPFASQVLRLNLDGSATDTSSPVFAQGMRRPASISWSADGQLMWIAGIARGGVEAWAVDSFTSEAGTIRHAYAIPGSPPVDERAVVAGKSGALVVVAEDSQSLLRLVSNPRGDSAVIEWLLRNHFSDIQAIALGAANQLWVGSGRGLFLVTFQR